LPRSTKNTCSNERASRGRNDHAALRACHNVRGRELRCGVRVQRRCAAFSTRMRDGSLPSRASAHPLGARCEWSPSDGLRVGDHRRRSVLSRSTHGNTQDSCGGLRPNQLVDRGDPRYRPKRWQNSTRERATLRARFTSRSPENLSTVPAPNSREGAAVGNSHRDLTRDLGWCPRRLRLGLSQQAIANSYWGGQHGKRSDRTSSRF
jgi:hypothetical protein